MRARCLFVVVSCLLGQLCFAHGLQDHISQMTNVFNGYDAMKPDGGKYKVSFLRYYERFSYELDYQVESRGSHTNKYTLCWYIRQALKEAYKTNSICLHFKNHREYGHSWTMWKDVRDDIPIMKALEKEYPGATKIVNEIWKKEFCPRHYRFAGELFGKKGHNRISKAFASVVHCIHLLGDLEPGNERVDLVCPIEKIIEEISRQSAILFDADQGSEIEVALKRAMSSPGDGKAKARAVMKRLIELRLGTRLHNKYGNQIENKNKPGCKWSGDLGGETGSELKTVSTGNNSSKN